MQTRSNNILVGAVTLALVAALAAFTIWLARFGDGEQKYYDIFFAQSVSGLAKGSDVLYSGVPVGEVKTIALWERDPGFVRVRISVKDDTPVLQGTTATILSGFTGVSQIQLEGGVRGKPAIIEPGPAGVPVIPTKPGALGELLNNAPLLLERLSTLTARLTDLLSEENQQSFGAILNNVEQVTGNVAEITQGMSGQGPLLAETLRETRLAIANAGRAADELAQLAATANQTLGDEQEGALAELRVTLQQANRTMAAAERAIANAEPAVDGLANDTLPQLNSLIRDLRGTAKNLNELTDQINDQGIGSLVGEDLPDYED